jgi:hypothetical protein
MQSSFVAHYSLLRFTNPFLAQYRSGHWRQSDPLGSVPSENYKEQSNAKGSFSGPIPAPTFQQIVGSF